MTPQEFQYIKRAVEAIESGECTPMAEAKILQTMSEICGKNATAIKQQLVDRVDQNIANNNLVDILSR